MAKLITPEGEEKTVKPAKGHKYFSAQEIEEYVGGTSALYNLSPSDLKQYWLIVNDEFIKLQLPVNKKATELYSKHRGYFYQLQGPVLVLEKNEVEQEGGL